MILPYAGDTFNANSNDDMFLIDTILNQFIPLFMDINSLIEETDNKKVVAKIHDLILHLTDNTSGNGKNKKKKLYNRDSNIKYEEKEFLYKTYISSSDKKDGTFKFLFDNTLKISHITPHMVRGLLILIKEELLIKRVQTHSYSDNSMCPLIEKLKHVKKLVIIESKAFDFKLLFILLNFIVLKFCINLHEINFEGVFYSRIDQIDIMIKNGVYLHFIHKSTKISRFFITNKIEFINENVAFKILHEFCLKNNISDIETDKIEFNKINIFSVLAYKNNLTSLIINKICIDKNSTIQSIIRIITKNPLLTKIYIDKFVSVPEHFRREIQLSLNNLKYLEKLKINVLSSSKDDLQLLLIPNCNMKINKFNCKLSRVSLEEKDELISERYFNFTNSKLEKLSLHFEKLGLSNSTSNNLTHRIFINNIISDNLRYLSIGMIDEVFLNQFIKLPASNLLKFKRLKFKLSAINDDYYEETYKMVNYIIENCKTAQIIQFNNFYLKYKQIGDDDIKSILKNNRNLQKLVISVDIPYYIKHLEGFHYYEYPKFLIPTVIFAFQSNKNLSKLLKKPILTNILEFHRIKKDKVIILSYKI